MIGTRIWAQNDTTQIVYLEHSETLSFDEQRLPDAQILRGNVCFRHDSALMYCDSAYFYDKQNSLHAFGHVHLIQGDSIETSGLGGIYPKGIHIGTIDQIVTKKNITLRRL